MAQLTTFVFTDLVGSVDLKRRMPGASAAERDMAYVQRVLTPHRERIERELADSGGRVVSTAGDGHFLVFSDTVRAAKWAVAVQQSHRDKPILPDSQATETPDRATVNVRIGLHVGATQVDPSDPDNFIGRAVDYAARLADYARSGQVLASRSAASLIEDAALDGVRICSHGRRELRGIGEVEVHELVYKGQKPAAPRGAPAEGEPRRWTVLPQTMGLTEYTERGSSNAATAAPVAKVGNYELGELLGAGGMGNVYKARHTQFGKQRAVKIIRPDLVAAGGDSVVRRFYQEIRATGALEHPNLVVAIDSSAPEDEQHYLVMEYIDGIGVDDLIEALGPLPIADACEVARQAALGLEHLHRQGLVHRDVKPSNLMLTLVDDPGLSGSQPISNPARLPVAKLMDLGLALLSTQNNERLTRMDQGGMGTGLYMSPEQWRTTTVDIRADIYSLGCTLYHLLAGDPPFAQSDLRPQKAHEQETPPPLGRRDLPPELLRLLNRMLAKSPDDRPQTPFEVAEALAPLAANNLLDQRIEEALAGTGSTAHGGHAETHPIPQASRDTKSPKRNLLNHSTASRTVERVRWIAPTLLAIAVGVVAINLAWLYANVQEQLLAKHRATLLRTSQSTADSLEFQIKERFSRLQTLAMGDELSQWLSEIAKQPTDEKLWANPQAWIERQKSRADAEFNSISWFIADERGVQIARSPSSATIGQNYASRDYFHGLGSNFSDAKMGSLQKVPAPISEPHLSAVYRSSSTKELKVAFSVPIDNGSKQNRKVIGVLAMSVSLEQFTALADTEKANRDLDGVEDVEILLVDTRPDTVDANLNDADEKGERGLVLHHRTLNNSKRSVRLPAALLEEISAAQSTGNDRLLKPYGDLFNRGGVYLGAFAPVVVVNPQDRLDTEWVVIAQEPQP